MSTVGTSQISPETDWLRALTILETLSASLLVTLILTFLFGVYQVVRDLRALSSNFYTGEDDTGDALASLRPYFPQGQPVGLDGHLQAISGSFWAYTDGLRLHHIAYYFQSGRDQFSLPYSLHMLGRTLAALRWGLPQGHPSSREPALTQLISQFERFADYLHDQLGWTSRTVPEVVAFEDFSRAQDSPNEAGDLWVSRFLRLDRDMASLATFDVSADRQAAYERYRQWLPFAYRAEQVAAAVSRDLDYQPVTRAGVPDAGIAGTESRRRGPFAMTTWTQRWRVFVYRWVAVPDPGLIRLMTAAGSTLAGVAAVATVYFLFRLVGAPTLPTAMFGGMVGIFAVTMPSDARKADRQFTTALFVIPAIAGAALGAAVAPSFALSTAVLVIVVLLGVGIGNLGARFGAMGQMSFMACYFALLLHPGLSALAFFAGAAIVGVIWAYLFRFVLFVERPGRVVCGGLDAFRARLILMLDPLIDAVSAARWDPDVRRRVRADSRQLRRCATFLQGRLRIADPALARASGTRPGELRLQVFDAELAATNVLAAAQECARAGAEMPVVLRGELAGILDRAQDRLRHQIPAASNASATDTGRQVQEDRTQMRKRWPHQARRLDDAAGELLRVFGILAEAQSAALADSTTAANEVADTDSHATRPDPASSRGPSAPSPDSWLVTPTSRRAVQAAVATGLALLVGTLVTSTHQYWAALAAFLVLGGTTTIEETVMKGAERVAGTVIGAVIGFEIAIFTGADPFVVLPLVVVCIFAGMYLRPVSYALMVFWMTIMLALLYELIGALTTETLPVRVGETVIGAVVALGAAALLLPVRTRQKVTRDGVALLERIDAILQACLEHLAGNTDVRAVPSLATQALALEQQMHQLNATAEPLRRAPGALGPQGIERRLTAATALTNHARQLIKVTETSTRAAGQLPASECTQLGTLTHHNIAALIRVLKGEHPGPVHRSEDFPLRSLEPRQAQEAGGTDRNAVYYVAQINQTVLALIDDLTPSIAADATRPAEARKQAKPNS